MPRETDNAERPTTLPPPELNPLLNPILGKNMGRWAEVYFTSPPDERDHAVLGLLRELEEHDEEKDPAQRKHAEPEEPITLRSVRDPDPVPWASADSPIAGTAPTLAHCPACGRENLSQYKFCGMCGKPLEESTPSPASVTNEGVPEDLGQVAPQPAVQRHSAAPGGSFLFLSENEILSITDDTSQADTSQAETSYDENRYQAYDPPSSFGSFRIYAGVAIAALVLALVYLGWRSEQDTTHSTRLSPSPSALKADPPGNNNSPENQAAAPPQQVAQPQAKAEPVPQQPVQDKASSEPAPKPRRVAAPRPASPAVNPPQPQTAPVGGSAELAMAQSYLNGTNGQQRNSQEAMKWLWKAVEKRNAAATLQLSDLYLRGDGVPKNCDQARVLLGAAARNGMKSASDRLQHLQAFGCN